MSEIRNRSGFSVSKTLTGLLAGMLEDRGVLDAGDDPHCPAGVRAGLDADVAVDKSAGRPPIAGADCPAPEETTETAMSPYKHGYSWITNQVTRV